MIIFVNIEQMLRTKNKPTPHWDKHAGGLVITLFSNVAPTENGSSYRMEAQNIFTTDLTENS